MSLIKRIGGVFRPSEPGTRKQPKTPPAPPETHRERMRRRSENPGEPPDDDITARFATAFEALEQTASGTELVKEICRGLTDESDKLKRLLAPPPKKAHE